MKEKTLMKKGVLHKSLVLFLAAVICILYIPFTAFADNNTGIDAIEGKVIYNDDKTSATVSFDTSQLSEGYAVTSFTDDSGTELKKNGTNYSYDVTENSTYKFTVSYTDGIKDAEDKLIEKTAEKNVEVVEISLGETKEKSTEDTLSSVTTQPLGAPSPRTADVEINETNFPDANFREYVANDTIDTDSNGILSNAEIAAVTSMDVSLKSILSLKGIEFFTALTSLNVENNQLTELDVSNNTALKSLNASNNQLTELDVSKNTALTSLAIGSNQLTELDVSRNIALTALHVYSNQLTELDVSKNTVLTSLDVMDNQLTELEVSRNTALTYLGVSGNQLTELDVNKNTALTILLVAHNRLTELDVSKNTALTTLIAEYNQLTEMDVSENAVLNRLQVHCNQLEKLNISANPLLDWIDCRFNKLTSIDFGNMVNNAAPAVPRMQAAHQTNGTIKYVDNRDGTYSVDLNQIKSIIGDSNFDISKVTIADGGILDQKTGIVKYSFEPITVTYDYDYFSTTTDFETGKTEMVDVVVNVEKNEPEVIVTPDEPGSTVKETANSDTTTSQPQTGDNSELALWLTLLLTSGALAGVVAKRRKSDNQ